MGPRPGHPRRGRRRAGRLVPRARARERRRERGAGRARPRWPGRTTYAGSPARCGWSRSPTCRRLRRPPRTRGCGCTCSATGWFAPRTISMEGIFGLLTNVVWTSAGPCAVADFEQTRARLMAGGRAGDRVRRGQVPADGRLRAAHRGADRRRRPGPARRPPRRGDDGDARGVRQLQRRDARDLDGRGPDLRAASWSTTDSDVGGGASIMGTLSGGGTEVISVGKRCLIGANAGLGISLGDDCVVEAGCYVTAGTKVTVARPRTARAAGGQGARAVRASTTCCSAATRSPARSRRCRGAATASRSTPRCTPTDDSAGHPRTLGPVRRRRAGWWVVGIAVVALLAGVGWFAIRSDVVPFLAPDQCTAEVGGPHRRCWNRRRRGTPG